MYVGPKYKWMVALVVPGIVLSLCVSPAGIGVLVFCYWKKLGSKFPACMCVREYMSL